MTRNLSDSGALLHIDLPKHLAAGDDLDLCVAWTSRPVLPADSLMGGLIVRVMASTEGGVDIAVKFRSAAALPIAA